MSGATGDFEAIYLAQRDRLLRIVYLVSGDRDLAEDAVADAVARTWRRWERTTIDDPGAYLRRAVVNAVTDRLRRRSRDRARAAHVDPGPTPGSAADVIVDHQVLVTAMAGLAVDQRVVLVLRYFDDQSEAATAATLGIPAGTVKSRTSRALAALAEALHDTEEAHDA